LIAVFLEGAIRHLIAFQKLIKFQVSSSNRFLHHTKIKLLINPERVYDIPETGKSKLEKKMEGSNDHFADYGIDHLSASQINTFISNPCRWILRVSGYTDKAGNSNMWRGTAADDAVCAMLGGSSKAEALEIGRQSWKNRLDFAVNWYGSEDNLKEADKSLGANFGKLDVYINAALDFYEHKTRLLETQKKISIQDESLPIPIIGYIDLEYSDLIRDIKTTARKPANGQLTEGVSRQMSVYWKATGKIPVADYIIVTAKSVSVETLPVFDVQDHWETTIRAAKAMHKVLSISSDIEKIADYFMPDFSDWSWSEGEIQEAKKLWRIK